MNYSLINSIKAGLTLTISLFVTNGYAQIIPPLQVPYIHTRPADLSGIRAYARQESIDRYTEFKIETNKIFARMVSNIDMLPIDKLFFTIEFNKVRTSQNGAIEENPYIWNFQKNIEEAGEWFEEKALNQTLIQQAKTRYTRVLSWETHLREKDLLDKPYNNTKGINNLTNRQALSILYGTDNLAFTNLAWE